jgi:hypothetical protein
VPIKVCKTQARDGHGASDIDCEVRCEIDFAPEGTKRRSLLEKIWGITDVNPVRGHHHPYIEGHYHWPHYLMDGVNIHGVNNGKGTNTGGEDQ